MRTEMTDFNCLFLQVEDGTLRFRRAVAAAGRAALRRGCGEVRRRGSVLSGHFWCWGTGEVSESRGTWGHG